MKSPHNSANCLARHFGGALIRCGFLASLALLLAPASASAQLTLLGAGRGSAAAASGGYLLNLDFTAGQTPEANGGTVSRSGAATAENSDGTIVFKTTNQSQVGTAGLLVESQRTNIVAQSNDFSSGTAYWTGNVTPIPGATGPDGTTSAWTVPLTTTTSTLRPNPGLGVTGGGTYTFSFLAKRGTASDIKYSAYCQQGTSPYPGELLTPNSQSYYAAINSSTFSRVQVVFTPGATCSQVWVYPARDSGVTGNFILFGAQLEAGGYSTSYIPTTGSFTARNATSITFALNVPTASSFALNGGFKTTRATSTTRTVFDWNDGTDANKILLEIDSTNHAKLTIINASASTVIATEGGSPAASRTATYSVTYTSGTWELLINGVSVATGAASKPSVTNLRLGATRGGANFLEDFLTTIQIQ